MGEKKATKTFSMKPIQKQMLDTMQQQYFSTLSNFLSFLALEMWGYQVTANTKFEIKGNEVVISEDEPEPEPESEVTTSMDIAGAIKK